MGLVHRKMRLAKLFTIFSLILSTSPGVSNGFPGALMGSTSSYSTSLTSLTFSVTSGGTTAFCDLSFSTDLSCISHAEVACTLLSEEGTKPYRGEVEYSGNFIKRINGIAYNIDAVVTLSPSTNSISSLILCISPTCTLSSSSLQQDWCMDYSAGCGSSSSSSSWSSSSPSHSTFKYISSSYVSFSSSSSSSSCSSSTDGEGLALFFGSSPTFSSSECSVADFAWSSTSEGVVMAWPSFESSFSTKTSSSSSLTSSSQSSSSSSTVFTTTIAAVTNSRGSVIDV